MTKGRKWAGSKLRTIDRLVTGIAFVMASFGLNSGEIYGSEANLLSLEARIWTADDQDLPGLEKQIVRQMQEKPNSTFVHYLLSHLTLRMLAVDPSDAALMEQATNAAQQAIDLNTREEFGYIALAELLDLSGHPDKALTLLREITRAGVSASWRLDFTIARLSVDSLPHHEVMALFERAMADSTVSRDIVIPYIIAVIQSGKEETDIAELEKWNERYPHESFRQILAIRHSEAGNYHKAHEEYRRIIKDNPNNREALINDAILLYKHLNNHKESIALFDRAEKSGSTPMPDGIRTIYCAHRGSVLLHLKQKNEAFKSYLEALRLAESADSMVDFIGTDFRAEGKIADLVEFLQLANEEIPGSPVMHAYLGQLYSDRLGDQSSALESFANAITLEPSVSHYYNLMGLAYYKLEEFSDALKLFTAAVKVDPFDATAKYNEACVLARTGRTAMALDSLAGAIELDPSLRQTASSDVDFSELAKLRKFRDLVSTAPNTDVAH